MATRRLSDEYIRSLAPPPLKNGKPTYAVYWDAGRGAVQSLGLRITTGNARSWINSGRYPSGRRTDGKHNPTMRKVGEWPAVRLAEAREIALDWNRDIAKGIDPQERLAFEQRAKQAAREEALRAEARKRAGTFANVAEAFIKHRASKMRCGDEVARLIRQNLITRWGERPVDDISKTDVIALIEDLAEKDGRRGGAYAARQAFAYGSLIFTWALEREDPRKPTLGMTVNPFGAVRINNLIGKAAPRQRTLSDRELALIWQATEGDPLATYPLGPYIRLLLILGVRRNELAQAVWDEIDSDKAEWKLEAARTKGGATRIVPLPQKAVQILRTLPTLGSPYLFSTGRSPIRNFSRMKRAIDAKVTALNGRPIAPWRLHDLRRTARTNWSKLVIRLREGDPPTPLLPVVAEMMLGHKQRGIAPVYDTYTYAREQRAGFEAWCARLRSIVEPHSDNVVELRA
jgi:integrase